MGRKLNLTADDYAITKKPVVEEAPVKEEKKEVKPAAPEKTAPKKAVEEKPAPKAEQPVKAVNTAKPAKKRFSMLFEEDLYNFVNMYSNEQGIPAVALVNSIVREKMESIGWEDPYEKVKRLEKLLSEKG